MPEGSCPVDHSTRSKWSDLTSSSSHSDPATQSTMLDSSAPSSLPVAREVSSIPRTRSENWVYPSEAQFFAAMARKHYDPQASDMRVIVPIHNAVNERAWAAVKAWETGQSGCNCTDVRLVSFMGKPGNRSPKAWVKVLLGYSAPFDRHDWIIDRCGLRMRYVIDFYAGRPDPSAPHLPSFYIDARPALDNWEGIRMRLERFWERWIGKFQGSSEESLLLQNKGPKAGSA